MLYDQPSPQLFPGRSDWTTTEAQVVDPAYLLNLFDSCRSCSLARREFSPSVPLPVVAYAGHLNGADLSGATLSGDFSRWNLSDAKLSGATLAGASLTGAFLDKTRVDGTNFDNADLRGAELTVLRDRALPSFDGVKVGSFDGSCTFFRDMDLVNTTLTLAEVAPGCESKPLFPGSSAPLGVIANLARLHAQRQVSLTDTRFVADAGDRDKLAGADLDGVRLTGSSFTGFPAKLVKTRFDGASLAHTSFDLADLSGASFHNANLTGASFRGADLSAGGGEKGATFAGSKTDLNRAVLVGADISGASFVGADISGAVFSRVLAADTDFGGVNGEGAVFSGAHIYGDGQAFDSARDLRDADFNGAVLAGDVDASGGFNFTHTDLTGATFDAAQCIGCNFTGSRLDEARFNGAYLPGAILAGVVSLRGVKLLDARLYCGNRSNGSCPKVGESNKRWSWPLALGSGENYGPVPFADTDVSKLSLDDVSVCPDGKGGSVPPTGCIGHLQPDPDHAPPIPAACSAAGPGASPASTSTVFDGSSIGLRPLSLTPATPPNWATTLTRRGIYAGFNDGTIRLLASGEDVSSEPIEVRAVVAGEHGVQCPAPGVHCGDGGPARRALLGIPSGLAVGLDGSLYIADSLLHRVRRIDPSGTITTVAGDGQACAPEAQDCGDNGPATHAALAGPYGVWVDPKGQIDIADGTHGVREVLSNGTIVSGGAANFDVRSVVGDLDGNLYAATNDPDYIIRVAAKDSAVTKVVGISPLGRSQSSERACSRSLTPAIRAYVDSARAPASAGQRGPASRVWGAAARAARAPEPTRSVESIQSICADSAPASGPPGPELAVVHS